LLVVSSLHLQNSNFQHAVKLRGSTCIAVAKCCEISQFFSRQNISRLLFWFLHVPNLLNVKMYRHRLPDFVPVGQTVMEILHFIFSLWQLSALFKKIYFLVVRGW